MDLDFDYLLEQFSVFDHNDLEVILTDFSLKNKISFYFLCRLLIEEGKDKVSSKELITCIIKDLRKRGINIVRRGNLYFINDPLINPSFVDDPDSSSQKGRFNPDEWFGKSLENQLQACEIKKLILDLIKNGLTLWMEARKGVDMNIGWFRIRKKLSGKLCYTL